MHYEAKALPLKDGREAILRVPTPADAPEMLRYLIGIGGETEYVLAYPEERQNMTVEREEAFIRRMAESDSALMLLSQLNKDNEQMSEERKRLFEVSARNTELSARLDGYTRYEALSVEMGKELNALFPQIDRVCLANVVEARTDTVASQRMVAAIVNVAAGRKLSPDERKRFQAFMKARVPADSLLVVWR